MKTYQVRIVRQESFTLEIDASSKEAAIAEAKEECEHEPFDGEYTFKVRAM